MNDFDKVVYLMDNSADVKRAVAEELKHPAYAIAKEVYKDVKTIKDQFEAIQELMKRINDPIMLMRVQGIDPHKIWEEGESRAGYNMWTDPDFLVNLTENYKRNHPYTPFSEWF